MKDTLIVGCSYVAALGATSDSKIDIFGSPGAGNASIAARVIYQLSQHNYKKVIILWSGINRLDLPVDIILHNLYQLVDKPYKFYDIQDAIVWYHSGGFLGIGTHYLKTFPGITGKLFKEQYKTASPRFLTTQTLMIVISMQALLERMQIEYHMDFIYDIHKDYTNTKFGYSLGQIDTTSPLYNLVNWTRVDQHESMYEWTKRNNKFCRDAFHPTPDAAREWLFHHLGVSIPSNRN